MAEWPYVMFVETLVFLLIGAGAVLLQNTLTGVAFFAFPPLVTAALGAEALAWALGVVGLVLVVATESDATDGLGSALLRGGRAACGVVLMHVAAVGALCGAHSDTDMCIAMASGNHLFPSDTAFVYYVFAIVLALNIAVVGVCLLVAQHGALRAVARRSAPAYTPRLSWNLSLVLLALYETQFTMQHNAATAFAPRQVYAAWQTLIGVPTLFVLDIACAKFVATARLWSKIMAVVVLVLVVGGHATLLVLFPVLRSTDTLPVNLAVTALLVLCTVLDIVSILAREERVSSPGAAQGAAVAMAAAQVTQAPLLTREGLFELPVRSGVRHVIDARIQRRPAIDLRARERLDPRDYQQELRPELRPGTRPDTRPELRAALRKKHQ